MLVHASTVFSRSSTAILNHISQLAGQYSRHQLLFSLSPNVDASELSELVQNLTTFSSNVTGCLSATVGMASCSLAIFDGKCVPFRSTIPGVPSPQVGRWHSFRKKDRDTPSFEEEYGKGVDWTDVWSKRTSTLELPDGLQDLQRDSVDALIYFSDAAPEGLRSSFHANFPAASKLGLVPTSTPFITGRPVTLFQNQRIWDSGAVGVALTNVKNVRSMLDYHGLVSLSSVMTVTEMEGNLVNTLDRRNPTQLLLSAIREHNLDVTSLKTEEEFYLMTEDTQIVSAYTITAGDPSRGTISLNTDQGPGVGSRVRFYHRPKSLSGRELTIEKPRATMFKFMVADDSVSVQSDAILDGVFFSASENGFLYQQHAACSIPGATATLEIE
ncbi:hypothetical protein IW261DRAFT_1339028 [Armillaria novae-zelandiae]|uniref:FIST domain-containing protein n=1 Tax=Armillaria novae-zelandiae TaxID=153914 RepID=A0AA39P3R8_9AGAR|nr:hypothetical protein IW261DRAFT_1339028 [Armillaria novae-zelandiae]